MTEITLIQREIESLQPVKERVEVQKQRLKDITQKLTSLSQKYTSADEERVLLEIALDEEYYQVLEEKVMTQRCLIKREEELQEEKKEQGLTSLEHQVKGQEIARLKTQLEQKAQHQTNIRQQEVKLKHDLSEQGATIQNLKEKQIELKKKCQQQLEKTTQIESNNTFDIVSQDASRSLEGKLRTVRQLKGNWECFETCLTAEDQAIEESLRVRIIELEKQSSMDQIRAQNIKLKLNKESELQKDLTMRIKLLESSKEVVDNIHTANSGQHTRLQVQWQKQKTTNDSLRSKLVSLRQTLGQLESVHHQLSSSFSTYKNRDVTSLRSLSTRSTKTERGLTLQRHFIQERQDIVDMYRKFLPSRE